MRFYSDLTHKFYESEKECKVAENKFCEERDKAEAEKKAKEAAISKEKKELSKAIDDAKERVKAAHTQYDIANEKAQKLIEDARKQAAALLEPAKEEIKAANEAEFEAVKAFNEKFGTYTIRLTGQDALDEYRNTKNFLDSIFRDFWF